MDRKLVVHSWPGEGNLIAVSLMVGLVCAIPGFSAEKERTAQVQTTTSEGTEPPDGSESLNSPAPQADKPERDRRAMRIRVLGPEGRPMPGTNIHASVWTKEPFAPNRDYVCGADGEAVVELPWTIRILRIWARKEGHVPLFAQWWPEQQPDGHLIPEEFTFHLQKGTVIGGIVRNEDGQPIAGASVEVMRVAGVLERERQQRPRLGTWLAEGDDEPCSARATDADGRWTLNNVPAGDDVEVRVKLSHPDYIDDRTWGGLQAEQRVSMKSLRNRTGTIVMQRGISVTGTVADPNSEPVPGAVVVWGDDPYFQDGSQEVVTDGRGVFQFPPLAPGPTSVTVIARGWAPDLRKIEVTPANPAVDFQLKPGKTIRIRFEDDLGAALPDVVVGIDRWRGGQSLYNHKHPNVVDTKIPRKADENGIYEWTWAPGDAVTFEFWKAGYRESGSQSLSAVDDDSEYEITLTPELFVFGKVTDAKTGDLLPQFRVTPAYGEPIPQLQSPHGTVHARNGQYRLVFEDPSPLVYVLIEADGYAPVQSQLFSDANGMIRFNAELRKQVPQSNDSSPRD